MNIAILADIHSNYIALRTCIEYALQRDVKHSHTHSCYSVLQG